MNSRVDVIDLTGNDAEDDRPQRTSSVFDRIITKLEQRPTLLAMKECHVKRYRRSLPYFSLYCAYDLRTLRQLQNWLRMKVSTAASWKYGSADKVLLHCVTKLLSARGAKLDEDAEADAKNCVQAAWVDALIVSVCMKRNENAVRLMARHLHLCTRLLDSRDDGYGVHQTRFLKLAIVSISTHLLGGLLFLIPDSQQIHAIRTCIEFVKSRDETLFPQVRSEVLQQRFDTFFPKLDSLPQKHLQPIRLIASCAVARDVQNESDDFVRYLYRHVREPRRGDFFGAVFEAFEGAYQPSIQGNYLLQLAILARDTSGIAVLADPPFHVGASSLSVRTQFLLNEQQSMAGNTAFVSALLRIGMNPLGVGATLMAQRAFEREHFDTLDLLLAHGQNLDTMQRTVAVHSDNQASFVRKHQDANDSATPAPKRTKSND